MFSRRKASSGRLASLRWLSAQRRNSAARSSGVRDSQTALDDEIGRNTIVSSVVSSENSWYFAASLRSSGGKYKPPSSLVLTIEFIGVPINSVRRNFGI